MGMKRAKKKSDEALRLRTENALLQQQLDKALVTDPPDLLKANIQIQKLKGEKQLMAKELSAAREAIVDLESRNELLLQLSDTKRKRLHVPPKKQSGLKKRSGSAELILTANDWHIGAVARPAALKYRNKFDHNIAQQRVQAYTWRSLEMLEQERKLVPIDKLHICYLGDIIDGRLHEDSDVDLETNDQVFLAEDLMVWQLRTLLKHGGFKEVNAYMLCGNHGRQSKKIPYAKLTQTSNETVAYRHVIKYLENEPINFIRPEAYSHECKIQGVDVSMEHGHNVGGGGGIGGVPSAVRLNLAKRQERNKINLVAHFHQWAYVPSNGYALLNCLCGWTAYGRDKINAWPSDPSQGMFVLHNTKVTKSIEIWAMEKGAPMLYED